MGWDLEDEEEEKGVEGGLDAVDVDDSWGWRWLVVWVGVIVWEFYGVNKCLVLVLDRLVVYRSMRSVY